MVDNTITANKWLDDVKEFAQLMKYELKIDVSIENIIDSVKYLRTKGFRVYKDHR